MKGKILSLVMAATLIVGSIALTEPNQVRAEQTPELTAEQQKGGLTQDSMEEVILTVKNKVKVDDGIYTKFEYDYWENGEGIIWEFYWSSEDNEKYINVSSDNDGHIISYYCRDYKKDGSSLPGYTKAELLPKAEEYIKSLIPEAYGKLKLKESSFRIYNNSYEFIFNRVENGIEMPDNAVRVTISAESGLLENILCEWLYDGELPSPEGKMSEKEAKAAIKKGIDMELQYRIGYQMNGNGKSEQKVFLAYLPSVNYISVDALSGEIYNEKHSWEYTLENGNRKEGSDSAAKDEEAVAGGAVISDAELEKITELSKLISKEKAVSLIMDNDELYVDRNAQKVSATLRKSDSRYVWELRLNDARPIDDESDDTFRSYIVANVDAESGEIIRFYSSVKSLYDYSEDELAQVKVKYTKNQSQKKLAAFAKEQNKEHFESSKLTEKSGDYILNYREDGITPVYGGFDFRYTRVNEEVPLYSNYIYGAVDAVTGKIYRYGCNWNDNLELPSTKGVIGNDAALDAYLGYEGFGLVYEIYSVSGYEMQNYFKESNVRLVYSTEINPYYVDAFTGRQLDYTGDEYDKSANEYKYTDISGTKYERQIELLADMGVGFKATKFEPSKAITKGEFQSLLDGISIFQRDKKLSGNKNMTRQAAAKQIGILLNVGKIAEATDIFKTGYKDEASIDGKLIGYVAIAKGLGIMDAVKDNEFMPKQSLTRGEAANIIIKMLQHV